jgi:hypothetical protein
VRRQRRVRRAHDVDRRPERERRARALLRDRDLRAGRDEVEEPVAVDVRRKHAGRAAAHQPPGMPPEPAARGGVLQEHLDLHGLRRVVRDHHVGGPVAIEVGHREPPAVDGGALPGRVELRRAERDGRGRIAQPHRDAGGARDRRGAATREADEVVEAVAVEIDEHEVHQLRFGRHQDGVPQRRETGAILQQHLHLRAVRDQQVGEPVAIHVRDTDRSRGGLRPAAGHGRFELQAVARHVAEQRRTTEAADHDVQTSVRVHVAECDGLRGAAGRERERQRETAARFLPVEQHAARHLAAGTAVAALRYHDVRPPVAVEVTDRERIDVRALREQVGVLGRVAERAALRLPFDDEVGAPRRRVGLDGLVRADEIRAAVAVEVRERETPVQPAGRVRARGERRMSTPAAARGHERGRHHQRRNRATAPPHG